MKNFPVHCCWRLSAVLCSVSHRKYVGVSGAVNAHTPPQRTDSESTDHWESALTPARDDPQKQRWHKEGQLGQIARVLQSALCCLHKMWNWPEIVRTIVLIFRKSSLYEAHFPTYPDLSVPYFGLTSLRIACRFFRTFPLTNIGVLYLLTALSE